MTWLPTEILRVWVGVGMDVGVGVGVGVGVVLRSGMEFRVRSIAGTDTHLGWLPCHLATMSLGNEIIN